MFFVFVGAWTAAALISNNDSYAQATGYGARIGAEIGSTCTEIAGTVTCPAPTGCQQNADDPCAVDGEILGAMQPSLKQATNSTPVEIEIYQPTSCQPSSLGVLPSSCSPSGYGPPATGDLIDPYKYCAATGTWDLISGTGTATGSGNCITGLVGDYTLDQRSQTIDDEQAVGVWVSFTFTPPGPEFGFFKQTDSAYTAITFPPEGS
jgi:hypothetical protein